MQSPPTSGVITECTMFRWIRTSEMCFSMKLYTVDRDSVAYDEETARLDDLLDSNEVVPHQGEPWATRDRGTGCKGSCGAKVVLTSHFKSLCHIHSEW